MFLVVRKAVLMEDEGRQSIERSFVTKAEAVDWVAAQVNKYFGPHDYFILEAPDPQTSAD